MLFFTVFNGAAQNGIEGRWYTFTRSNVIEFTLKKDSLVSRRLFWDLGPNIYSRHYYQSNAIIETRSVNGKFYYAIEELKRGDDGKAGSKKKTVGISIFKITRSGKELYLLSAAPEKYTDSVSLTNYIASDTTTKPGMIFLSESEIMRLKKLPAITTMNVEDCKRYCEKIKEMQTVLAADSVSKNLYYAYFMTHYLAGEVGYSPLFTTEEFGAWFKRFQKDPATKLLFEELFKE